MKFSSEGVEGSIKLLQSERFEEKDYIVKGRPTYAVMRSILKLIPLEYEYRDKIEFMVERLCNLINSGEMPVEMQWNFADEIMKYIRPNPDLPWTLLCLRIYTGEEDYRKWI